MARSIDVEHVVCSTNIDRVRGESRVTLFQSTDALLDHPHITYPNILQTLADNDDDKINDSVMESSTPTTVNLDNAVSSRSSAGGADVDSIRREAHCQITPDNSQRCTSSEKFKYTGWSLQNDRIRQRDDGDSDQDSDDSGEHKGCDGIEDSSDSETEQGWITKSNRSLSMKRRKVNEDEEDDEEDDEEREEKELRSHDIYRKATFAQASDHHVVHTETTEYSPVPSTKSSTQQQQQQRPSSCPARKRRSVLVESLPSFSLASQQMDTLGSKDIDTSSLSLLSATSELVSSGTIPNLVDNECDTLQPILAIPSVSPILSSPSPSPPSSISSLTSSFSDSQYSFMLSSFTFNDTDNIDNNDVSTTNKRRSGSSPYRHRHSHPLFLKACRKRTFEDAIELGRPLGKDPSVELHRGCWFGSIKRRKIHHFPTRWTSTLSPSPYVKLMAMRDFWDIMKSRLDLSWLDLWTVTTSKWQGFEKVIVEEETEAESDMDIGNKEVAGAITTTSTDAMTEQQMELDCVSRWCEKDEELSYAESPVSRLRAHRRRTLVQHPSTSLFLRGLWEEEERSKRQRQMIPECVHRPMRSKILNRKPIPKMSVAKNQSPTAWIFSKAERDATLASSSSSSSLSYASDSSDQTMVDSDDEDAFTKDDLKSEQEPSQKRQQQRQQQADQEMTLRKKPTATIRSNALADGGDLNEYKHWKDATVSPNTGSIRKLYQMRRTVLHPWPVEESQAKDECTRMLHRMREQLNVVINLQIYLRTAMKATPSQASFMLSIRHPGQISVELLNELYGPQFLQTNAFRSIERLLWGNSPTPRIEHRHSSHHHEQFQQRQSNSSSPQSYAYSHSQVSEYQFHDRDDEYEDELHSRAHGYSHHQHHQHQYHQHHQHHQGHQNHCNEGDNGYRFEEEFDYQSQDSMLGMDHIVDISSHIKGDDRERDAIAAESSIESLAVVPSKSQVDMLVELERDIGY
ncbi:hypothetical protein BGX27_010253 [Mortierella sp. AM989]|nr:hypothetical protein BGX27_010253 [Mortierella sp. AM989]